MNENAIILGAGASYDAGVPLLGKFMDVMLEMHHTKRFGPIDLSPHDQDLIAQAAKIHSKVDDYHARVSVDQFNIEEVLSVLSFESISGDIARKRELSTFTKAIARTVEITCKVKHDGTLNTVQSSGDDSYRRFWLELLRYYKYRLIEIPTIISFNYDLVLERALFQTIIGFTYPDLTPGLAPGFYIDYCGDQMGTIGYSFKRASFNLGRDHGTVLEKVEIDRHNPPSDFIRIPILKLHGSLNFPKKGSKEPLNPVDALADPQIIPPIFNKTEATFASPIWKEALRALRGCRNLLVCGYSLPVTDTYMQYFLKAALGPNQRLNKVFVYDPILYSAAGESLMDRYSRCLSPQFRPRIIFRPPGDRGTFKDMVSTFAETLDGMLPPPTSENRLQAQDRLRRAREARQKN